MTTLEDAREALARRLENKYRFFKRMSFDGYEHETMILLREAASALRALEAQPEPEWEYGERSGITPGHVWGPWPKDLAAPPGSAVRRRKAGPWEPVPDRSSDE